MSASFVHVIPFLSPVVQRLVARVEATGEPWGVALRRFEGLTWSMFKEDVARGHASASARGLDMPPRCTPESLRRAIIKRARERKKLLNAIFHPLFSNPLPDFDARLAAIRNDADNKRLMVDVRGDLDRMRHFAKVDAQRPNRHQEPVVDCAKS
ncbi:MAG: hypothetical protein KDC95_13535 [Planctomycetes bacterium]|nr:hypothetical protein [Planctomycetota bacterium]